MTVVQSYYWDVVMRNDRMGYIKKFQPRACDAEDAITAAWFELEAVPHKTKPGQPAYNADDFAVVSVLRRDTVRETEKIDVGAQLRALRKDMEEAHAEGMHDDLPRDGCPVCDDQQGRTR